MAKREQYVAKSVRYVTTRRGVNAYAQLWLGATYVGEVEDKAEAIVAPVHFAKPEYRAPFLKVAKANVKNPMVESESYIISEYARALITVTEN